jgi:hypothetical protein
MRHLIVRFLLWLACAIERTDGKQHSSVRIIRGLDEAIQQLAEENDEDW